MVGGPPIPVQRAIAPVHTYVPPRLETAPAATPRPVARGQKADAPAVRIPTPEELGLTTSRVVAGDEAVDWSMVERRLDAVGATGHQIERAEAGFRFTCQLPTGPVTGRGASKGEAVRSALAQLPR